MHPMEVMGTGQLIPISSSDTSQVGQARRRAVAIAAALGFGEVRLGELSIIVTEAANNIAAHANEGQLIVSPWSLEGQAGVDIFAIDKGRGILDIHQACEDGFSTGGTAGQGLGAVSRLAGQFQVSSAPNSGTILFARVYRDLAKPDVAIKDSSLGAISIPIAGETACGDAWSASFDGSRSVYLMADGLGHGPFASEAAREAVRIFQDIPDRAPEFILKEIHRSLTKTRGAAVSIAEILHDQGTLNYAGAGNISCVVYSAGKTKSCVSMNGTVGHSVAKFQQFSYPWENNATLILHSDGLTTRWNLDQYPGLASRHPAVIAALLYRDFVRGRDDVTVLVTRK
jgi:anti-sigma regulatory factor (Ser/Thr protein kinase)